MTTFTMKPCRLTHMWKYNGSGILAITNDGKYELDEFSSFVWKHCNGNSTVQEIIENLVKSFAITEEHEKVERDVMNLLNKWKEKKVIVLNYHPFCASEEYDQAAFDDISEGVNESDVILIVPPSTNASTASNACNQFIFPLGIGYLSAVLKEKKFTVAAFNLLAKKVSEKGIKELIQKANPRIVGISCMTQNFLNGIKIAQLVKEVDRDIAVVFGGPHVTFTDVESMNNHPEIDVIVRYEGEQTILELADYYINQKGDLAEIKGVTYRDNGMVKQNARREIIKNLDSLPFPDRSFMENSTNKIGIHTSRGCPEACIFCVAKALAGGKYRTRGAENVVREIEELHEKGINYFTFHDENFTVDLKRIEKIFFLLKEKTIKIKWDAESRVDVVDRMPEIFDLLAENGCQVIQFGIESGSQTILNNLKKNISVDQVFRAIKAARRAKIKVFCSLLMGHPWDTREGIKQTIEFAKELNKAGAFVLFSLVCPFPGTEICVRADELNVKIRQTPYSDYFVSNAIIDTQFLKAEEIRGYFYDGTMEILKLNKKLELSQLWE